MICLPRNFWSFWAPSPRQRFLLLGTSRMPTVICVGLRSAMATAAISGSRTMVISTTHPRQVFLVRHGTVSHKQVLCALDGPLQIRTGAAAVKYKIGRIMRAISKLRSTNLVLAVFAAAALVLVAQPAQSL